MEILVAKSVPSFRPSAYKFREDNYPFHSPSCLGFWHSPCIRRPISSRQLLVHSHSHSRSHSRCLGGGSFHEVGRDFGPWRGRSGGVALRAAPEEIDLHCSNPHEDGTGDEAGADNEISLKKVLQALRDIASANFLLVALSCAIAFGLAWPAPGRAAQQMGVTKWCTSAIFLLSGLNLRSGDAEQGVSAWPAGLFGLVSILIITPLAAVPILSLQSSPRELVVGLAMFACVPTTLSSAVSMTQIAGANTALAIGMTVFSNLMSIVTMPFTLTALVGGGIGVSIAPRQLLQSLIQTLLVPLVLGKIIRETFSEVRKLVDGSRKRITMLSAVIQALVPWMQLSSSKELLLQVDPFKLLIVSAAGMALHISYLVTNSILMRLCPLPSLQEDYNSRAVLLASSQKSIVVCVAVIDRLGGAFGNAGLLVLPCVAAQFSQVIIDSMLVNSWLQHDARKRLRLMST